MEGMGPVSAAESSLGEPHGLTEAEATRLLEEHGHNELAESPPEPWWSRAVRQFADPLVYLLFAAIAVSLVVWAFEDFDGFPFDVAAITVIVLLNAAFGYAQEAKAEQSVAALKRLTAPLAVVVRSGRETEIEARLVVPGDVLVLREGDAIAADATLIEGAGLFVQEAALTGESQPVAKDPIDATGIDDPVGVDERHRVFSGTAVAAGRGRAVVTSTGMRTQVGRIAELLEATETEDTPLQREISRVSKLLGVSVVAIAVIVVVLLLVTGGADSPSDAADALLIGVSLGVAAIPEGLPAVLTLVLALGVQRMAGRHALIKRLASVETLGSSTVVCSDKTGTLTGNEMMVRLAVFGSGEVEFFGHGYDPVGEVEIDGGRYPDRVAIELERALTIGFLASDADVSLDGQDWVANGDPTEAAIVVAARKIGLDVAGLRSTTTRLGELGFTSARRRMSTAVQTASSDGGCLLMVKGAPDMLLDRSSAELAGGAERRLADDRRTWWLDRVDSLADQALRTLAVAYRKLEAPEVDAAVAGALTEEHEQDLVFLGVLGMVDPPRPEAKAAVEEARSAGVDVVMVTGDHPRTAVQIALELGIFQLGDRAVTGAEMAEWDDAHLAHLVPETTVFARVTPEHKLRIVHAFQSNGNITAMTGDGVNDAPSLKAADIGVAMGKGGTEVAREASDMILTDDNFATIVSAIREGRGIFHNIQSFLRYMMSSNVGEVLTVLFGVLLAGVLGLTDTTDSGVIAPLLATQILWINLLTDGLPGLALGVDPAEPWLMERPPRRRDEPVLDRDMWWSVGIVGSTMAVVTLFMLDLRLAGGLIDGDGDVTTARTGAFTVLVFAQLVHCFCSRSSTRSIFAGHGSNPWLWVAVGVSVPLQVAVVYVPVLNEAMGTAPLPWEDWLIAAALSTSIIWVTEADKLHRRRSLRASAVAG